MNLFKNWNFFSLQIIERSKSFFPYENQPSYFSSPHDWNVKFCKNKVDIFFFEGRKAHLAHLFSRKKAKLSKEVFDFFFYRAAETLLIHNSHFFLLKNLFWRFSRVFLVCSLNPETNISSKPQVYPSWSFLIINESDFSSLTFWSEFHPLLTPIL